MHTILFFILAFVSLALATTRPCDRETNFTGVEKIGEGVLVHPESIAVDSNGFLYTGINDGSIRKINPNTLEITTYLQ